MALTRRSKAASRLKFAKRIEGHGLVSRRSSRLQTYHVNPAIDELFEILTLIQTGKSPRAPVVLVDRGYWESVVKFDVLVAEGMIDAADLELFQYAADAEEAWAVISRHGLGATAGAWVDDAPSSKSPQKQQPAQICAQIRYCVR